MNKRYSRKNRLKKLRKSFKLGGAGDKPQDKNKQNQNKNAQDKNAPKENVKTEKPEGIKPTGNASIKIVFVSDGKGGEQPLVLEFPKLDNDMTRLIRQLSSYIDNTRQGQVALKEQASAIMENMKKEEEEKGEKEGEGPKKNVGRENFKKMTNPGSWFTNKDNAPEKAPENAPARRKSIGGKKTRRKTKSSSKTRRNLL